MTCDLFRACYFGCLQGCLKSVQVLFNGIEAVMVRTLFDSSEIASPELELWLLTQDIQGTTM